MSPSSSLSSGAGLLRWQVIGVGVGARMLMTLSLSSCPGMGMCSHTFMPAGLPVQFPTAEWPRSHCFNPIAAPATCSAANHDASRTMEIPTATSSVQSGLETLPMFAARQSAVNASSLSRDVATSLATATTGPRMPFHLQPEVKQGFPPRLHQYQVPHGLGLRALSYC